MTFRRPGEPTPLPKKQRRIDLCKACDHPLNLHPLSPDAASMVGPYLCRACMCETRFNSASYSVDHATFNRKFPPGTFAKKRLVR